MAKILISNDDGIHAPGILALVEVARKFGDVTVVAPDSPQSGMGHAISVGKVLRLEKEELPDGLIGHACSGTPADCIKIATGVVMDHTPDLVLSGINHGSNASINTIYSGTMSAAREGAIQGIPSIAFSVCDFSHDADLSACKIIIEQIIRKALAHPLKPGQCINVNIPYLPIDQIKGMRITHQGRGQWTEEFDQREDPFGRPYYWLTGKFEQLEDGPDCDQTALKNGYVAITPTMYDMTSHEEIAELKDWLV